MFQSFLFWIKRFDKQLSQPSTFLFNFIYHGYSFYPASASWTDTSEGKTIVTACYTPHRPLLYKTFLLPLGNHEEVLLFTIMMKYTHCDESNTCWRAFSLVYRSYNIPYKMTRQESHPPTNCTSFCNIYQINCIFITISFSISIIRRGYCRSL